MMQLTSLAGRNKMEIKDYDLLVFDVDGTIANRSEDRLLPEARDFFKLLYNWSAVVDVPKIALATNQGGVALRLWMEDAGWGEPEKYPSLEAVQMRLRTLQQQIPMPTMLYVAYAYQTQKTREWAPVPLAFAGQPAWSRAWRKPNGGMVQQAMADHGVSSPKRVLFVGDSDDDKGAATAVGAGFALARYFWAEVPNFLNLAAVQ